MLLGLLMALCAGGAGAGPVAYNQVVKVPPNPWRAEMAYYPPGMTNYGLFFMDTNNCATPVFTLRSEPTNGLLEYRPDLVNGQFTRIPLDEPLTNTTVQYPQANASKNYNNKYWSYTCTNGAMGVTNNLDSFTWQMTTTNGLSGVATCYLRVAQNKPPLAMDGYRVCAPGTGTWLALDFFDPDALPWNATSPCAQSWSAVVVTPPTNGTIASHGLFLLYTPSPGITQSFDRFTFKVNDTVEDSAPATCLVQIRAPDRRARNLVLLVVNDTLLATTLTNEINRLKDDLENEGYAARILGWHHAGSTSSNLWACLAAEYASPTQYLAGAILLGDLPQATLTTNTGGAQHGTDLVYWNLHYFQTLTSPTAPRDIWVSRICWPGGAYGDEVTLLRRALDANHGYRTGSARLPYQAFAYCTAKFSGLITDPQTVTRLQEVWPTADGRGGPSGTNKWFLPARADLRALEGYDCVGGDCLALGGEVLEQVSDAVSTSILWGDGLLEVGGLYRLINQVRFHVYYSCECGVYGGFANHTLFTRGGGGVMAVASSGPGLGSRAGEYMLAQCSLEDTFFRRLLNAGESMGAAAVQYYAFKSTFNDRTMFYGDLSLRVMAAPSNSLPVIRAFTYDIPPGHRPVLIDFSVDAYDPDGIVSKVEWFLDGYDYGRATPTAAGTLTNISRTYAPGVYTARVEVIDNYQARTWLEAVLTVADSSNCTVTVVTSGPGRSSLGGAAATAQIVPVGSATQIVYSAEDWYRIGTLAGNGLPLAEAAGSKIYTQTLVNIMADISNQCVFAAATNLIPQVPTDWLTNWPEQAILSDSAFPVLAKYLIGLDPTTSNTFALHIEDVRSSDSHLLLTLKRDYTGGLSPDGMHGQLIVQGADRVEDGFTNLAATAVSGAHVFDETGRRTFTHTNAGPTRFLRVVIQ